MHTHTRYLIVLLAGTVHGLLPARLHAAQRVTTQRSKHVQLARPVLCVAPEPDAVPEPSPLSRASAWIKQWASFDRERLAGLGVDALFTYGAVSNINAGALIALAWGIFSKASGLSPVAPGQWKPFLVTYAAVYASVGTVMRPFRMALAVSITPLYGRMVSSVQRFLPFSSTRPKLNRALTLILLQLLGNMALICSAIGIGIWTAGLVTGVPPFPPGWTNPFAR